MDGDGGMWGGDVGVVGGFEWMVMRCFVGWEEGVDGGGWWIWLVWGGGVLSLQGLHV